MGKISTLVISTVLTAALGMSAGMAAAETKLRIAVETTSGDPLNAMLAGFRDALEESAGDDFDIDFFEGNALGSGFITRT